MARKVQVTNELYDLSYRHLAAAGIDLRPLGLPAVPPIEADPRARLLARVDLFAVLPRDELQKLAGRMSRHEYEPGEVVLAAGSVTDCLTIVESGVLSVMVDGSEGKVEVARLGPGEAIGESGVLAGLPVRATITTITRAVTWQLDKTDLTPLLKSQPALARQMCQMLSQRQDRLGKLGAVAPPAGDTQHTIFQWLWDGMRKLHDLAT
jgi:hypothetical protein